MENNPDYKGYTQVRSIRPVVQKLVAETGLDLSKGGGISDLLKFQEHFRHSKITVYQGLACEDIIFEGQVDYPKKINLLHDDVEQHYHVIVNITGVMSKKVLCNACKNQGRVPPPTTLSRHVATAWRFLHVITLA